MLKYKLKLQIQSILYLVLCWFVAQIDTLLINQNWELPKLWAKEHNIIQIHNIVMRDWQYVVEYSMLNVKNIPRNIVSPHNIVMDLNNVIEIAQNILIYMYGYNCWLWTQQTNKHNPRSWISLGD